MSSCPQPIQSCRNEQLQFDEIYIYILKKYNKDVPSISSIKAVCEETVAI